MKEKVWWIISFMLVLVLSDSSVTHARVWTDSRGRQLEADFVEISKVNPQKVILLLSNGKKVSYSITIFSKNDQDFIFAQDKIQSEVTEQDQTENQTVSEPSQTDPVEISVRSEEEEVLNDNPNIAVVTAEGCGETIEDAKRDALQSAVQKVVGTLVDATTRVENDEIIEKILTASNAYVEKHKVVKVKIDDGVYFVRIEAHVVKSAITGKLTMKPKKSVVSIDGSSILGKADSKAQAEIDGVMYLANFLKKENFPYSMIDVEFVGTPQITVTGNEYKYTCVWSYQVNLERYYAFVDRLIPILDELAIPKGEFMINVSENMKYDYRDHPIPYERDHRPITKGNFIFAVCTNTGSNFKNLRWKSYQFPPKYAILLSLYYNLIPCLDVSLLDEGENLVTSKFEIVKLDDDFCCYNLFPEIGYQYHRGMDNPSGTSLINNSTYYFFGLFSVGPFATQGNNSDVKVFPKLYCSTTFTLNQADVSKIKSASITVISNNPAMDKAYENLPDIIREVPTK